MKKRGLYIIIIILLSIIAYLCYDKFFISANKTITNETEDMFQRGLQCQELLNNYKSDKSSPEYALLGGFYSPVMKTCIGYYVENYTSAPTTYQIDDMLLGLSSHYIIYDSDFCNCSSDFLGGSYHPETCEKYSISTQREKEINRLKGIGKKPEL